MTKTLICDCNRSMPLDASALGAALNETLTLHSALCRRQAGSFQQALLAGEPLLVACTQEKRLFAELAEQTEGVSMDATHEAPLRFVNIRELGGWSKDARQAMPKLAALLAAAKLPPPEPVTTVSFRSRGQLLIIGPLDQAQAAADQLSDVLQVSLLVQGPGDQGGAQERRYPVLAGQIKQLSGWLGAFEVRIESGNPIDLDLCTRCNACVLACPQGAIGLDYQVDSARCQGHRDCVTACGALGAIDFQRAAQTHTQSFDLVLDLRDASAFTQHALPQGYFRQADTPTFMRLRELVGEFDKPRFFQYRQKLCAHSRNDKTGCSACIDVCSASAITSDKNLQQIKVNPNLCVGCGTCTTVCPSGALGYVYPRASEQGHKLKTLLTTYTQAGGTQAAVLLHSQGAGARLLDDLGRAARLDRDTHGIGARVLPVALWHTASVGLDLWLSAIAYGASQVWVLLTDEEAPQYLEALRAQMDVAQAILHGLGYTGEHFALLHARDARDLAELDRQLRVTPATTVARNASFAVQSDKRATLELALDHLIACAAERPASIALPAAGAPFGGLIINRDTCTLCLSCVSACPAGALQDNPAAPQLKFVEKNCVQCGLCVKTCPEKSLQLEPRLLLGAARGEARVINEAQPYGCVRCGKPFGTLKGIETMLARLSGHSMFQGEALERLKMCGDCRVIDIHSSTRESRITDL